MTNRLSLMLPAAALLGLAVIGAWLLFKRDAPAKETGLAMSSPPRLSRAPGGRLSRDESPRNNVLPIAPSGRDHDVANPAKGEAPAPSHPLTIAHVRIHRENNLIGQLHEALDGNDAAKLYGVLKEYRQEFPEDLHLMQSGFEIIARCLDHLDEPTRAAAGEYYHQQRASTLRRYIRRHCIDAP